MKTNNLIGTFMVIVLLFSSSGALHSQETGKSFLVYPTFGFGIGFFYPGDVNDYIQEELLAGVTDVINGDLYMYLEVKGGLTFRLKSADISLLAEYNIGPKIVTVSGGDDFSFAYTRFSPEISGNYYFPGKSGRNAFFIGAGINYSFMKFEEFSASAPGFKLQAGYSMQFGKFNLQPYGAFRYVKATDSSDAVWGDMDQYSEMELDYTGGQIGVILSFHPGMSYK
jgi:hypothetical protein